MVGLRVAAATRLDVGAVSRAEPPPAPMEGHPCSLSGSLPATFSGLGRPRTPGHQTQKPRVARGNGSSRTVLWARQVRGWRWGCGSLRPPALAGIVAQASRIPAKIIGIVSWLPQENVPHTSQCPAQRRFLSAAAANRVASSGQMARRSRWDSGWRQSATYRPNPCPQHQPVSAG